MDLFGAFRRLFGADRRLSTTQQPPEQDETRPDTHSRDFDDPFSTPGTFDSEDSFGNDWGRDFFGFNMFTNPLEMHRYFEQQMDEFIKRFTIMGPSSLPESDSDTLRDRMLKAPDTQSAMGYVEDSEKVDADLDNHGIQELFPSQVQPPQQRSQLHEPLVKSFYNSVRIQRIQLPDGTVEERRTVRDSTGKEETSVTRSKGEQKHCFIVRKDGSGNQDSTEDFVNMNEGAEIPFASPGFGDWSSFRNFFGFK